MQKAFRKLLTVGVAVALTSIAARPAGKRLVPKATVANGDWTSGTVWGGTVPAAGDTVTINHNVRMNTSPPALGSLTISGTGLLRLGSSNTNRILDVDGDVSVALGGTIQHTSAAQSAIHTFRVGGNLSNSGTFGMGWDGNSYISLVFDGATDAAVTQAGTPTWDLWPVTFNKTAAANTVTMQAPGFWTAGSGTLTFTSGIYVHDTPSTWNMTFNSGQTTITVGANAGIRILQGSLTMLTTTLGNFLELYGGLELQGGSMTVGDASDERILYFTGSRFTVDNAASTLTCASRLTSNVPTETITWNQSNGTVLLNTAGAPFTTNAVLQIGDPGSSFTMSGGTIVIQNPTDANSTADYRVIAGAGVVSGGAVQFGNASTPASTTFRVTSANPIYNLTVNGSGSAPRPTLRCVDCRLRVLNNFTLDAGTTFDPNGFETFVAGNWTNNGTMTVGAADTANTVFAGTTTIVSSAAPAFNHVAVPGAVTLPAATVSVQGNLSSTGTITPGSSTLAMTGTAARAIRHEYVKTGGAAAESNRPAAIPDTAPGTVSIPLDVSGLNPGTITNVKVVIHVLHVRDDNLDIFLRHPDATTVELTTDNGALGDDYVNTMFDAAAGTSITAGAAPFTGTFAPEGLLSALNGKTADGTWNLDVTDDAGGNLGTVLAWSLWVTTTGSGGPIVLNHFTVNPSAAVTKTAEWPLDVNGDFLLSAGTFAPGTYTHTVFGNWDDTGGTFTPAAGTINFDGTGAQSIATGAANNFFNVTMSNAGTNTATTALNLDGNFLLSAGAFVPGGFTHTVAGGWDDSAGAFTPGAGTVNFDGTGAQSIATGAANNFFDVTISNAGTNTATTALNVDGNFLLSGGAFVPGSFTHTVFGAWDDSGGTFTPAAGTINFDGTGAQSIAAGGTNNFFNVTMSNAGTNTATTALNIDGNFLLSAGVFVPGGFTHTVAGGWDDSAGTFTPAAGTFNFDGTGAQSIATGAANNFFNVTISNAGTTTATTVLDIDGNVLISGGDFTAGAFTHTVAGDWTRTGGTFTPGTGTITFDAGVNQTIGSSETFNGLTIDKGGGNFIITDGTTTTAGGPFTITGTTPTITGTGVAGYGLTLSGAVTVPGATVNYANSVTIGGTSAAISFNNVAFGNFFSAIGSRYLTFTRTSLDLNCIGCTFAAGPNGADRYNVVATDTDGGDNVRVNFEFRGAGVHGAGAGEGLDSDADSDADGVSNSPAGGAVVTWSYAIGTPQGTPQGAINMSTYTWDANYAVVTGAGGLSYVMVLDAAGAVLYAYTVDEATYGSIVGAPWWDNDGVLGNKRVYFGTTGGYLFRLNDSGAALSAPAPFPINMNVGFAPTCTEVTSPVVADASRIYFGGLSGGTPYVYSIAVVGGASWSWATLPNPSAAVRSQMGFAYDWGAGTYIFAASDGGVVYKITASSGGVPVGFNVGGGAMRAPLTIGGMSTWTQHLVIGDYAGQLHMIDADSSTFLDYAGTWPFPLSGGGEVRASALYNATPEISYVGDSNGRVHKVSEAGAYVAPYPVLMPDASAIETSPLFEGSYLYFGNNNGKVYVITEATGAVFSTRDYGPGLKVTGFSWADLGGPNGSIMFTLSNGKTYYLALP